jgi:hypothetical protein
MFPKDDEKPDTDDEKPDTDEGADDSDDQDDDASDDDADGGEGKDKEKPNLFFDPNKLPPELKGPFKAMQASFTKKMQKASLGLKKAEAFDELLQEPRFHAWMEAYKAGRLGPDGMPARSARRGRTSSDDDDDDDDSKEKPDSVRALIRDEITKALRPQESARALDSARVEFEQFKSDYPEYVNYQDDMKEVLDKNPGLSFEQAFKIASFGDASSEGGRRALKTLSGKKRANVSKDEGGDIPPKPAKGAKSILEAYEQAKKASNRR